MEVFKLQVLNDVAIRVVHFWVFKANNRLIEDGYSRLFINILICNASPSLYIFSVLAAAVPVVIAI